MAIYLPTPGFKGRAFKLYVLTRWDFNFCIRSSPLRCHHNSTADVDEGNDEADIQNDAGSEVDEEGEEHR